MPRPPQFIAFDAMETLFDLSPLKAKLEAASLPGSALPLWFARTLRDGFALAAADVYQPFKAVARAALKETATDFGRRLDDAAAENILGGFGELPAHPDVADGLRAAKNAGMGVAVLANGNADLLRKLVRTAGVDAWVDHVVSIDDVRQWKPKREVYLYAAKIAGVQPEAMAMVAAHPWDLQGAKRAGLTTGWISRSGHDFNAAMDPPDATGASLTELVRNLLALA